MDCAGWKGVQGRAVVFTAPAAICAQQQKGFHIFLQAQAIVKPLNLIALRGTRGHAGRWSNLRMARMAWM